MMNTKEICEILNNSTDVDVIRDLTEQITLETIYNEDIILSLVAKFNDENVAIRDAVSRALSEVPSYLIEFASKNIVPFIVPDDIEVRNLAGDVLAKYDTTACPSLYEYLRSSDQDVRKFACDIIGLIGDQTSANYVYQLLSDEDPNCVSSAIECLGNIKDGESVLKLVDIYNDNDNDNDDYKPVIIDALGKIGTKEALDTLLELLRKENDVFLKTTIIDSLSIASDSVTVAEDLFLQLPEADENIKLIMLKTIFAIAHRTEQPIVLPDDLRYIAYMALDDDDEDIRISGLLALGDNYQHRDFDCLLKEIFRNSQDTQQLIAGNLLINGTPELIEAFIERYADFASEENNFSCDIEFISNFAEFQEYVPEENRIRLYETVQRIITTRDIQDGQVIMDTLGMSFEE